jgi:uncharacterized SAM-binding protein YcdF (DUF218 family)
MAKTPTAEVAIVLGGAVGQPLPPRVEAGLSETSDRVLHAARLYKAGKIKRILVTAGNIPWVSSVKPEAELIKDLLVEWGVPSEAIERASQSRNTHENALELCGSGTSPKVRRATSLRVAAVDYRCLSTSR